MKKRLLHGKHFLVGLTLVKIFFYDEFFVFLARQKVSLSKYFKAHPRQVWLVMRCLVASQMRTVVTRAFNYTFLINSSQFQTYLCYVQHFLKGGKVTDNIQFFTEGYPVRKVSPIAGRLKSNDYI